MDESKLNRIMNMIREDIPTNNISSGNIKPATELGDDPIVRKKKKKYAYLGPRSRKTWMPNKQIGSINTQQLDNNNNSVNTALLERLEKIVESLQDNSVKMGNLLSVHNEKLDKQDRIDAVLFEKIDSLHREVNRQSTEIKNGCERDIKLVDERLRLMEKKMWSIFGSLAIISFMVSPIGQRFLGQVLTTPEVSAIIQEN